MFRRSRRGGSAIEFALTLPVLITIIAATLEWGWYFSRQMSVMDAVREGARLGAATARASDPATAADARVRTVLADLGVNNTGATVAVSLQGAFPDELIRVEVSVPYDPIVDLIPTPGNMTHAMTMRLEEQIEP